ncbi:hypothetical protein [Stackebrandtia nassauensis]|uniref:Uncharacterized protein n=1 Tax=Stackebrandtia nassauensis (strain DSM 44728 / CIP 108903 / NRRL B-16338 / NBRC 102104 / LLR-40K-21) TaxID=446470 RepID=D3PWR9_STANL|nr:hypothetical protein [Stackebrandtia nassauensis]ADD43291.1 hypothetical protein Snas_3631 [Stackebrandtia nassauensis DSM 44728]
MNVDIAILGVLIIAAVTTYFLRGKKPRRILDELCKEDTIATSLRLSQVRGIVLRALRHPLGALVVENPNHFECSFSHRVRGVAYTVALRIDLHVRSTHRANGVWVRVGVVEMDFPGTMTDPAFRAAFGDVVVLRKRVIRALATADITSTRSTVNITWAHRTHCVRAGW